MAQLVGHLSADFSSFTKAVDTAVVSLKGFEGSAAKVGDSLQRMTDKFQGNKLIQDAVLMAKAVENIGGVSMLTAKELQSMGATASEAIEKMQLSGKPIPDNLRAIADGAKAADKATFDWKNTLMGAAGALGIAFSAGAVLKGIKDQIAASIAYADTLSNLSAATSVSVEGLQRLEAIGLTSGVSMQTLAGAVTTLQKELNDPGAKAAIRNMGLDYDTIRRLAPEEQFLQIAKAIAAIEDPVARANAGVELFKGSWATVAPAIGKNVDDILKHVKTLSADQIKALDAVGDDWDTFFHDIHIGVTGFIADLAAGDAAMDKAGILGDWIWKSPTLPDLPKAPGAQTWAYGKTTVDPSAISSMEVYGKTLDQTAEASKRLAEAEKVTTKTRSDFLEMSKSGLGPQFAWQEQLALTKFKADQLTVSETQLTEATETLADFVASHQGQNELFPEPTDGSLEAWKQGELAILKIQPAASTLRGDIDSLAQSFAQLGQIGGKGLGDVSRGMGTLIGATNTAFSAVDSLKNGFKSFSGGGLLSGIASLTSGIGGIVGVATAAIGAVKALWSAAKGGEQGQVVNPARDAWFGGRSVQDIGDQLAPYMSGNDAMKLINNVFNAKTNKDFGAASGEIDRILRGNSYAQGTGGFKDFGSGTLAMLHGREAVVPEGQALGGSMTVVINAQGAFFDTPGDLQRLAEKINDALTAKYGLTNRARAA